MRSTALAFAAFVLAALPARAHYLWIEPSASGLVLRFGEIQENLRETADTRLGEIPDPSAQVARGDRWLPARLVRRFDGFAFSETGAAATAVASEVGVRDLTRNGLGVVKPIFYARYAEEAARPPATLALDLVPVAVGRVRLVWNGASLASAPVSIYSPGAAVLNATTDAAGEIALPAGSAGLVVLDAIHVETKSGVFGGVAHQAVRHRATLALRRADPPATR